MKTAHQEWPRIDGAVNQGEEHYGHHKAPLCLTGEWTGRFYESWVYLALGMMELTVSTLGRLKIQLAFKNGPEGLLRLSWRSASHFFSLSRAYLKLKKDYILLGNNVCVGGGERFWIYRLLCVWIPSVPLEAVWSVGGGRGGLGSKSQTGHLSIIYVSNPFSSQPSGFLSLKLSSIEWGQYPNYRSLWGSDELMIVKHLT